MQLASLRLLLDNGREGEVREGLGHVEGLLERMAALTGHLKTFARKSPAGLQQHLALADVLEQALQLLSPRIRSEQVEVFRQVPNEATVRGDAIRTEQVLINLLHNALDAMAERPQRRLRILCERAGDAWQLSVADNGGGIPASSWISVRALLHHQTGGPGARSGPAVSYGIVRDMGGTLEVSNDEQGAVFTLTLPAAEAHATE